MKLNNKQLGETDMTTPESGVEAPTKRSYTVQENYEIFHGGRSYKAGERIEATPEQAAVHGDALK